jgi:hypothetical protein
MNDRARALEEMNRLHRQIRDEGEGGDDSQPTRGLITDPTSERKKGTGVNRADGTKELESQRRSAQRG